MTGLVASGARNRARPGGAAAGALTGHRAATLFTVLASATGVVAAVVGTLVLLRPNLAVSSANEARITNVAIEPRVRLEDYVHHPTVARVLTDPGQLLQMNLGASATVGSVVHFDFEAVGYNRRGVTTRWTVFDSDSGERIGESEDLDPLPFAIRRFEKRDVDVGSWESWIHVPGSSGRSVFVRLELVDRTMGVRLVFRDTPAFRLP